MIKTFSILFIIFSASIFSASLVEGFRPLTFQPQITAIGLNETTKGNSENTLQIFQSENEDILKILSEKVEDNLTEKEIASLIEQKIKSFHNNFKNTVVPYAGMITTKMTCEYKKNIKEGKQITPQSTIYFFNLNASKNNNFEPCLNDKNQKHSQYEIIYCQKKKTIYQIKFFSTKIKPTGPLASCSN